MKNWQFIILIITIIGCTIFIGKTISEKSDYSKEIYDYLKIYMPHEDNIKTDKDLINDVHKIMLNLDGSLDDIVYYMKK